MALDRNVEKNSQLFGSALVDLYWLSRKENGVQNKNVHMLRLKRRKVNESSLTLYLLKYDFRSPGNDGSGLVDLLI